MRRQRPTGIREINRALGQRQQMSMVEGFFALLVKKTFAILAKSDCRCYNKDKQNGFRVREKTTNVVSYLQYTTFGRSFTYRVSITDLSYGHFFISTTRTIVEIFSKNKLLLLRFSFDTM